MDLPELIDLGKRLGLSGDELTEWALEEQRLWREEIALDIEAAKRLAEIGKERAEIENKTFKLRQRLEELEARRSEARLSKDGGKSFHRVQAFSPTRSSADKLSPPLDVARDANEHRELDVTVEHQAALSSPDKETSLSLSPQVAALHLTLSGFDEVNVDHKPCLEHSPSQKRSSVPKEVLITDRDFPPPHMLIQSVHGSRRKYGPPKHRRRCFGQRNFRNKRTKRKPGGARKRTKVGELEEAPRRLAPGLRGVQSKAVKAKADAHEHWEAEPAVEQFLRARTPRCAAKEKKGHAAS
ncbi:hypothetical protein HPB48_017412 [Haemaphysalis longicornis]|uniref:Uncharacterized protein n=1 Tax=Haemaphysalis longicornis TaxID=44386 RepID=A0A9J6GGV0_HAELO|nr:hypothetical protein HPB48_017412 [Haemaphysalis longicornis]